MADLFTKLKKSYLLLILIYLPPLAILAAATVLSIYIQVPIGDFTRDPSAIVELHSYEGIVSNLGALVWCAAATLCLFCAALLLSKDLASPLGAFLLLAGATTGLLMVDDFFLLHEKLDALGLSEHLVALVYGGLVLIMFWRYLEQMKQGNLVILLSALCLLAASAGVDMIEHPLEQWIGQWRVLFEDGFKFLGLVGWFGYFAPLCFVAIQQQLVVHEALMQPKPFFLFERKQRTVQQQLTR